MLTRSVCCACLCPTVGQARQALVLGVLSGVTHLISSHAPVYWLSCKSWWAHRTLVHFLRVLLPLVHL